MADDSAAREVIVEGPSSGFRQDVYAGPHITVADEPTSFGGTDAGFTPYDLVLAGLGACTSMTISMYARRKGWPLEAVRVRLRHSKIHAVDCADCETRAGKLDQIDREIELTGALDQAQRDRLLEIADKCPVHRTLTSEIRIATRLRAP